MKPPAEITFVTDTVVRRNSGQLKGPRYSKYRRMTDRIASHPDKWGILFTSYKASSAHAMRAHLRRRFSTRPDGTPYMEFKVFRNPTTNGVMRWSVVGRLPIDNAL